MSEGRETTPEFHCDICGSDTHDALACDPLPVSAGRETTPEEDAPMTNSGKPEGPWCPVCRLPVPATGMAWTFPPHGGCDGEGRRVRDADHGFVTEDGRTVPEWEFGQ